MQFNKLSSMLAMILAAHLSLFSFAAAADVTFDGSSVNIPHLKFGDEAYAFDFDLIDAENMSFQINLSTAVDITNSTNLDSIPDAVFDGSAIIISRLLVDKTIYLLKFDLIDANDYIFTVDVGALQIVGSNSGDDPINEYYGTKMPFFAAAPPQDYELFSPTVATDGRLEGVYHEPTAEPGAGKFVFNRVYRAFKHGLESGQQFGVFGSWLHSYGNNSVEGGLIVIPKTAGPHYYPTLHLAGIGDTYHACNDVQMGSGLYERFLGDRWLTMVQISNTVLSVPGVNIAFDKDQEPYEADNGIWLGSGWTYLNLDHPRDFKYWMSFIETYDYQGPINGYMPEHFNWIDPAKIANGDYAQRQEEFGDEFGTLATMGTRQNWGNGNERINLKALALGNDTYYFPAPNIPNFKEREYLVQHPQSIEQVDMESYSSALKLNNLSETLIPTTVKDFFNAGNDTHTQLKLVENIDGKSVV